MKRYLLALILFTNYCFSQSNGITYQAVIYNPNGEELPGVDNSYAPLTNQYICLQFGILDVNKGLEYQEQVQVTTDAFGMVNLLIGTNTQTGGYASSFEKIVWSSDAKFLKVDIDTKGRCTNFIELSNQPFTYVPFAYYSPASDVPGPKGDKGDKGADGADGAMGATGPKGDKGDKGADGADGAMGATGPKGDKGDKGADGADGAMGATGPKGDKGDKGADGADAVKTLINTINEAPGANCTNGGFKIEVGEDANFNGALETDEIDDSLTRYVCNGEDGIDGQDGLNFSSIGGVNSDSGFIIKNNWDFFGFNGKLSGDGNIFASQSTSSEKIYIFSVTNNNLNLYGTIELPDKLISIQAINYDGSIISVHHSGGEKQSFFQFQNGNYEILQTISTKDLNSIDFNSIYINSISNNADRFITSKYIYRKNNDSWGQEGVLEHDINLNSHNPQRIINHSFTIYAQAEFASINGLTNNNVIRVYNYSNGVSNQKGNDIYGLFNNEAIGWYDGGISMDEAGNTIAYILDYGEKVRVHSYDDSTNQWNQKGQDISRSIYVPDGISSKFKCVYLSENGAILTIVERASEIGQFDSIVRYKFESGVWIQFGSDLPFYPYSTGGNYVMENNTFIYFGYYKSFIKKYD